MDIEKSSPILLKYQTAQGNFLQASFLPGQGMNLVSFKKGELEVIEQSTRALFQERYAGLGALIGPHFHRRKPETIPPIEDDSLFPHIARVKAKGIQDPFSHGIARYAPWKAESTPDSVKATLSGKDTWNGVPLSSLEGQNFHMTLEAKLGEEGLSIHLSIVSDTTSLVGTHYYYALPQGKGKIVSSVQNKMISNDKLQLIPSHWAFDAHQSLIFDLEEEADFTFHPYPNPLKGKILLDTETYKLQVSYTSCNGENCWQLYHPKGASFVCIEPISARNPRHPNLTVSSIDIHLSFLEGI